MTRVLCVADFHFGARKCPGLEWLRSILAAEKPDILVIAGDLFDKKCVVATDVPMVGSFLESLPIPIVLIWGNHDAFAGIPAAFPALANVYRPTFSGVQIPGHSLIFHGCDVIERRDNRELTSSFPVASESGHIGVFHTSLTGEWSKNPCLPCTLPELLSCNYNAWILGHVHDTVSLSDEPPIFWPGLGKYRVLEF